MNRTLKQLDEESLKEVIKKFNIENFDYKGKLKKKYRRKLEEWKEIIMKD